MKGQLQWVRGPRAAGTKDDYNEALETIELQWVRGPRAAGTFVAAVAKGGGVTASMGPRPEGRGNENGWKRSDVASRKLQWVRGPRAAGTPAGQRSGERPVRRFNGSAARGPRE